MVCLYVSRCVSDVNVCVYVYVCVYLCLHASLCACVSMSVCLYLCVYVCVYMCPIASLCACVSMSVCLCLCVYACVSMSVCIYESVSAPEFLQAAADKRWNSGNILTKPEQKQIAQKGVDLPSHC